MTKDRAPKCKHREHEVIVTNQPSTIDLSRPHRSVWVCSREECVWDAMEWVMRATGDKYWWRIGTAGGWRDEKYEAAG